MAGPPDGRRLIALVLILFAVAFAARVVGTGPLRPDGGDVRTPSPDAHYLLKRTVDTYRSFPAAASWEPGLSCPDGTAPPWPHGLDLSGAAIARLVLGADAESAAVERLVAWLPPAVGALSCAFLGLIGGLWFGVRAGLLAGLLGALMPIRVWNSAFAIVDHHVLGGLLPVGMVACFVIADRRQRKDATKSRVLDGWLLAGVVAGVGYATWTEMWLQQGLLLAIGLLWALWDRAATERRGQRLAGLCRWTLWSTAFAAPGLLTAPYYLHDRVAPHAPGVFTWWMLAAFSAAAVAAWAVGRSPKRGPWTIAVAAGGGGLGVLALAFALGGGMHDAMVAAAGFAGSGGIVGAIDESRSLFSRPMPQPLTLLSGAILLAPALPLAWRRADPSLRLLLTLWFAASLPLALLQTRFAMAFSTPFCLALGCLLATGIPARPNKEDDPQASDRERRRWRWMRWLAALLALTVLPSLYFRSYWTVEHESRDRLVRWLAEHVPPLPKADGQQACLMAPWDVGHEVLRVGGLPVVAHPFTEHADRARIQRLAAFLFQDDLLGDWQPKHGDLRAVWIAAMDEQDIASHLGELGLTAPPGGDLLRSNWARLLFANGSAVHLAGAGGEQESLPGFGRLRRIRTSPLQVDGAATGGPPGPVHHDKIFLVVPGARIVGACRTGREIEASAMIQHPGAPPFRFAQIATCDAEGRFSLRVPYANSGMGHQLRASPAWTLAEDGDERWQSVVRQEDVELAREVTVTDLYADRP